MIPVQVTIVPLFLVMSRLELTNTLWALILPPHLQRVRHLLPAPAPPDACRGSSRRRPRIDGAGHGRIFFQILLPLSAPALATLAILCFTYWWNDLLLPLVMINDTQTQTLPAGLVLLAGRFSTGSLATIAAGITMAVVPVLIVFVAAPALHRAVHRRERHEAVTTTRVLPRVDAWATFTWTVRATWHELLPIIGVSVAWALAGLPLVVALGER